MFSSVCVTDNKMAYNYPATNYAVFAHDEILAISGGLSGVLDIGRLTSILTHIQNDDYYPSFEEKLTHLVYAVNKGHCFNDGNKRTSIAVGSFFMELNGLDALVTKFILCMENIAVHIAANKIDKNLLGEIIVSILTEDDFSESIKLRMIDALS
jgi:death-on-curing protein